MHALLNRCRTLRGAGGKQQEPRFSHLNASIKQQTQQQQTQPRRASVAARVATLSRPEPASTTGRPAGGHDANQTIREGDYEADLVRAQVRRGLNPPVSTSTLLVARNTRQTAL